MRRRLVPFACAAALVLTTAGPSYAQSNSGGANSNQNSNAGGGNLPPALQFVSDWTGLIANVYGAGQGIQFLVSLFNQGPDPQQQILDELNNISNQLSQLSNEVGEDFAGTDFQIKQQNLQTLLSNTTGLLSNLLGGFPVSMSQADLLLRQYMDQASQSTTFTHGFDDVATNGTTSAAASNIGGSTFSSSGGVAWKTLMPDRAPVSGDGEFQVYDWRVGIPTLLTIGTTALLIAEKIDPNFRTDEQYQAEFTGILTALQNNMATMVDGVRCGMNSVYITGGCSCPLGAICGSGCGAGSTGWQYGCADIYTGYNQTYNIPGMLTSFANAVQGSPYKSVTSCSNAVWLGAGTSSSADCNALADAYEQPVTATARDAVFAQMPLPAIRKAIGLFTQLTNPEQWNGPNGPAVWSGCSQAYNGSLLKAGDTGCKGSSDITLAPTNLGGFNSMIVASDVAGGQSFTTYSQPTQSWPQQFGNASPFANSWVTQGTPIPGDFTGDGRWDVALVGGPGWWSIPIAHALGDGTYFVTNRMTGIHASNCGYGVAPNGQCTRQNFSTTAAPAGVWSVEGDYTLDFTAVANLPGVQKINGDFNGDGFSDIALVGGAGWNSIPVAFGDSGGSFSEVTNYPSASFSQQWAVGHSGPVTGLSWFPQWAAASGVTAVAGDFNGDHLSDIALVEPVGSIDVAFSNGDGTFRVTRKGSINGSWYTTSGVRVLSADYDGDGKQDIALVGGSGWSSVPVAYSNGDGTFTVQNNSVDSDFTSMATWSEVASGDLDGDGLFDIGIVTDYTANYTAYVPEFLSAGRGGFATSFELRGYVNDNAADDFWAASCGSDCFYLSAIGAY